MRETILKLLKSTNLDDVILALHLAYKHESRDWFDSIMHYTLDETFLEYELAKDFEVCQFVWNGKYYYIDNYIIWTTVRFNISRESKLPLIILE